MPAYDVVLKKVPAVRVAEVRGVAPTMAQFGQTFDRLFDEAYDHIQQHGATVSGPGIAMFYDAEYRDTDIHVGACFPFQGKLESSPQVEVYELPAVETMASDVHHGSFSGLHQAYNAILKWAEANGYQIHVPTREVYLEYERGGDQSKYVTEVQFPVEKR